MILKAKGEEDFFEFEEVKSTNDFLKRRQDSLSSGAVCLTKRQTEGRGTKNRVWQNFEGDLIISFLLKGVKIDLLSALPLICALIVKRCVDRLGDLESEVKWPNDVVINGKKVCGILCESSCLSGKANVVCGAGLNLLTSESEFEEKGLPFACSIFSASNRSVEVKKALFVYLETAQKYLKGYFERGFDNSFKEEYQNCCASLKKEVELKLNDKKVKAYAQEVDNLGRLVLKKGDKVFKITQNEGSLHNFYKI